jgi:hypothetical protein
MGNGPVAYNSGLTSFMLTDSTTGAALYVGVLEDNDDGDDTASGGCDWVLSIRDEPKL